jgi:hypothetical protein
VHTVASLLKLYLRDLPEPVVPWSQYEGFLLCGQLMNADEAKVRVSFVGSALEESSWLLNTILVVTYFGKILCPTRCPQQKMADGANHGDCMVTISLHGCHNPIEK